jgi:cation:H+ antiporter
MDTPHIIQRGLDLTGRIVHTLEGSRIWQVVTDSGPVQMTVLFLLASMLMIWRLNAVEKKGFEGTLMGTLVMPYCSGFANLAFAFVMGRNGGDGRLVLENCIVNNATNLTLVLGVPAMIWGMRLHRKSKGMVDRISWFSLILTLIALIFFTGAVWTLARDGRLDFSDGLMLCGLFLFWQVIHVFEVMKHNIRQKQPFRYSILIDFLLAGLGAWACLYSIEELVSWVTLHGKGMLSLKNLGLLSGLLMVVPNALLAFYYSARGRADVAYSSQIGDCHICIPLCIGLYALFTPIDLPRSFDAGILTILGAGLTHLLLTVMAGRIPRIVGGALTAGYAIFFIKGIF